VAQAAEEKGKTDNKVQVADASGNIQSLNYKDIRGQQKTAGDHATNFKVAENKINTERRGNRAESMQSFSGVRNSIDILSSTLQRIYSGAAVGAGIGTLSLSPVGTVVGGAVGATVGGASALISGAAEIIRKRREIIQRVRSRVSGTPAASVGPSSGSGKSNPGTAGSSGNQGGGTP
jgi:hypothetical protein